MLDSKLRDRTGTGLAVTGFGQRLTVPAALRIADQASIAWIVHHSNGGILGYGTSRRIATDTQTLALIARDRGCAFPGCPVPAPWTERHHITPWAHGGATDLDNLVLLCGPHHDRFDQAGWTITLRDHIPWFTPPAHHGPQQTPIRNPRPPEPG